MSFYLRTAIGVGRYLLDTDRVLEILENRSGLDKIVHWQDQVVPLIDLRDLFRDTDGSDGACVLVSQTSGEAAGLLVDRVEGLIEISDSEFRPLPPIGRAGSLIDALCATLVDRRPVLRLRGERALAASREDRG